MSPIRCERCNAVRSLYPTARPWPGKGLGMYCHTCQDIVCHRRALLGQLLPMVLGVLAGAVLVVVLGLVWRW
jgi:hypothetical protein